MPLNGFVRERFVERYYWYGTHASHHGVFCIEDDGDTRQVYFMHRQVDGVGTALSDNEDEAASASCSQSDEAAVSSDLQDEVGPDLDPVSVSRAQRGGCLVGAFLWASQVLGAIGRVCTSKWIS